jgi:photosystem II stability/assembly factor-like uncharacterized protein
MREYLLVATPAEILRVDAGGASLSRGVGLRGHRPSGLSADPRVAGRAWCCTDRGGILRSDDAGATWSPAGLEGQRLMTVAASPARRDLIWVGAEPSAVWRSDDAGASWHRTDDLEKLPSSSEWSFPPRPDTHHVRWIGCHPGDPQRLWVAVEAGALIRTTDGGRSWADRVAGGPWDTHELAVHPDSAEVLRVAAGDGYFESRDGGASWTSPMDGLEVGYLRSVAIDPGDPEAVLVSASTGPRTAYVAGRSDGRLFRRRGDGHWQRVTAGWPHPPRTIAPLLAAGRRGGELWAADERGLRRSRDGGVSWVQVCTFEPVPDHLRGLVVVTAG